jgi:hypothetical protein
MQAFVNIVISAANEIVFNLSVRYIGSTVPRVKISDLFLEQATNLEYKKHSSSKFRVKAYLPLALFPAVCIMF